MNQQSYCRGFNWWLTVYPISKGYWMAYWCTTAKSIRLYVLMDNGGA